MKTLQKGDPNDTYWVKIFFFLGGGKKEFRARSPHRRPLAAIRVCRWRSLGSWRLVIFYRYRRPNLHICAVKKLAAQMLLILLFGILLTYAAMTANFPYRDAALYAIDQALGLDRRAYLDFVNNRPLLAELAGYSYLSYATAVCVGAEDADGRQPIAADLRRWMLAFGLALVATAAISVFTPAVEADVYRALTPQVYANIASAVYTHVPTLEALRAGTLHSIRLDNHEGLITFPSFIADAALMYIWALRTVP